MAKHMRIYVHANPHTKITNRGRVSCCTTPLKCELACLRACIYAPETISRLHSLVNDDSVAHKPVVNGKACEVGAE